MEGHDGSGKRGDTQPKSKRTQNFLVALLLSLASHTHAVALFTRLPRPRWCTSRNTASSSCFLFSFEGDGGGVCF